MNRLNRLNGLLRIEARRNALPPLFPVLALLVCTAPIARHLVPVALWPDRSDDVQGLLQMIGPFAAGVAAWTASREHRRAMTDLLASTPRSPWIRSLAAWAATVGWAVAFYLVCTAVIVAITASQTTWGHYIVWPTLSAVAGLTTCATVGFTAGRLLPGRVTTPLAAVGVFAVMAVGIESAIHGSGFGFLSPIYPALSLDNSVFYVARPDLALVQIAFDLGVTAALLSLIALRDARRTGTALAAGGLALTVCAIVMAADSRLRPGGVVVPALNDAAPAAAPYTPVCSHDQPLSVCVHPAYSGELSILSTAINKIAAPLVSTPGLAIRAQQSPEQGQGTGESPAEVTGSDSGSDAGTQVAFNDFIIQGATITPAAEASQFETDVALQLVTAPGTPRGHADPAQRAVALYLLQQADDTPSTASGPTKMSLLPDDPATTAAAQRLAALTATARHTWLTTHVSALRSGTLTLTELP